MAYQCSFALVHAASPDNVLGYLTVVGPLPKDAIVCVWSFTNMQKKTTISWNDGRGYALPSGIKFCQHNRETPASFTGDVVSMSDLASGKISTLKCKNHAQVDCLLIKACEAILIPDTELAGVAADSGGVKMAPTARPGPSGTIMRPVDEGIWNQVPGVNPNDEP